MSSGLFTASLRSTSALLGAEIERHLVMVLKAAAWLLIAWGWAAPFFFLRSRPLPGVRQGDLKPNFFLAAGVIPEMAFQFLFHLPKAGYILLYYPGLVLLGVFRMEGFFRPGQALRITYPACWTAVWALYFLFWPVKGTLPAAWKSGETIRKIAPLTAERIRLNDRLIIGWTQAIKAGYHPDSTFIIIGEGYDWRRATYQLPQYRVYLPFEEMIGECRGQLGIKGDIIYIKERLTIPPGVKKAVILTASPAWIDRNLKVEGKPPPEIAQLSAERYEVEIGAGFTAAGAAFVFK